MASSSHPKYDVFINFCGVDTRKGFTNTLFYHLKNKGINAFMDDDGLPRGQEIESSLMGAIEGSKLAVVVISVSYASSPWCLEELLKIVECNREFNQVVLPIFYNVDPFHVDKQIESFGDEFAKLKLSKSKDKIDKWSAALSFAANQAGWDLSKYRTEIDLIEEVAVDILRKLDSTSLMSDFAGLIGIDSRVEDIRKILSSESTNVQFIGIWGMGGIGKTTFVEVLYNQISDQFDASHFVENVSQQPIDKLASFRTKILSNILGAKVDQGTPNRPPIPVIRRLQTKKILIVLDNVSNDKQLTTLVGSKSSSWFGSGSKVIVISRDRKVFEGEDMTVYEVKELNSHDSVQLFCLNAFKRTHPPQDYVELSHTMVNYAKGVPLALKVLGSLLYKRNREEWEGTLGILEGSINLEIEEVLKLSYDELRWNEKMIFLDIACFFRGEDKDKVKDILDGCGFSASIGITRLIEKCLVTVRQDNKLEMHDLLQKMGWQIVQQEPSYRFGVCTRLWTPIEIHRLLISERGAREIEGIFLDVSKIRKVDLSPMAFSKMEHLRLLKFYKGPFSFDYSHESKISFSSGIQSLPDNLRYIHWDGYPCESLPSNFFAENIVELNMPNSQLKKLWNGVKYPLKLKVLDLKGCENLNTLPDLSFAIKLEQMILDECMGLLEIPTSIQRLQSLSYLSMRKCIKLQSLPSLVDLKSLKTLDLCECSSLTKFPETSSEIEVLNLFETKVTEWPQSMSSLDNMKDFIASKHLTTFPSTIYLSSLKLVNLSGCYNLKELPKIIGEIEKLDLSSTAIEELPSSIVDLTSLLELNLKNCKHLKILPNNISQFKRLEKLKLTGCSKLFSQSFSLSGLNSIQELYLGGCKLSKFPTWLSTLSSLQKLNLSSSNLESVPESIKQLSLLEVLDLGLCLKLQSLSELPSRVNDLAAYGCRLLKAVSSSFIAQGEQRKPRATNSKLPRYRFSFADCKRLEQDACSQIVANARLKIQQMANSRNKDLIWPLRASLPGNEIPECSHQCEGSSINAKLHPNWCNADFMGFAFYVIAYTKESAGISLSRKGAEILCSCNFKKDDDSVVDSHEIPFDIRETDSFKSNTLVIYYTGDIYSASRGNVLSKENHRDVSRVFFKFEDKQCKVLKCGFRLVYAESKNQAAPVVIEKGASVASKK